MNDTYFFAYFSGYEASSDLKQKTCVKILLMFGYFGACRLKVLVENLYVWFSPVFKMVKYMEPNENTLNKSR